MVEIAFESEQFLERVGKELRMAKSICQVGVAILVGDFDVVLAAFVMMEMGVDRSCISLLHPILDIGGCRVVVVEDCLSNPPFLVAEHVVSSQIIILVPMILYERHFRREVVPHPATCVLRQARLPLQVRPVHLRQRLVHLLLHRQVVLQLVDHVVIRVHFDTLLIVIPLRSDVLT